MSPGTSVRRSASDSGRVYRPVPVSACPLPRAAAK